MNKSELEHRLVSDEYLANLSVANICEIARNGLAPADRRAAYSELVRIEAGGFEIPDDIIEAFSRKRKR